MASGNDCKNLFRSPTKDKERNSSKETSQVPPVGFGKRKMGYRSSGDLFEESLSLLGRINLLRKIQEGLLFVESIYHFYKFRKNQYRILIQESRIFVR